MALPRLRQAVSCLADAWLVSLVWPAEVLSVVFPEMFKDLFQGVPLGLAFVHDLSLIGLDSCPG